MEKGDKMTLIWFVILLFLNDVRSQEIKIGVLLDVEDDTMIKTVLETQIALKNRYYEKNNINVQLTLQTEKVERDDDYAASEATCRLLEEGSIAIFGPIGRSSHHVKSICDVMEIPHMLTKSEPTPEKVSSVVNLFPHYSVMGDILVKLVNAYQWTVFTVFYENNESLPKLSNLLKMHDGNSFKISMRQLDLGNGGDYRGVFNEVKKSGDTRYIIDCSIDILFDVLIQAQQVGIMSDDHSYIITNFDLHTINIEPFKYGGSNFTGLRLVNPDDKYVQDIVAEFNEEETDDDKDNNIITTENLTSEAALFYDAMQVLIRGLEELYENEMIEDNLSFSCDDMDSWQHGNTLVNSMRSMHMKGLTGNINFDPDQGFRTDFSLDVMELSEDGLFKIGYWNLTEGLNITRPDATKVVPALEGSLSNESFIVITAISAPYGMLKDSSVTLKGNDRFEGFGIELIEEMSKMLGFNYTFVLEPNGAYGKQDKVTGEWDGMIKELLEDRAQLAITDLTITQERQTAVDFTNPFMNLGITILYKAPTKEPPKLFSFMSPFSSDVWLAVGSAYLGVSILLFIVARIAPKEWQNPYPCIQEPEKLSNQFSIPNSLWFTVGSVLQQGSELAPIAISTRMIAGIWWFFTLIMVSSYTANLAAFLTVEDLTSPFNNIEELANNKVGIKYGSKVGGSTLNFFKDSNNKVYQQIYEYMTTTEGVLMNDNKKARERVQTENYAYFMESTSIEYITERYCDVTQIGGLLDSKGYGIAMRKNMHYHDALTKAVLRLQEQGVLHKMKDKWWKEKCGGGACSGSDGDSGGSVALTLANVGGVFIVLVASCLGAIFISIAEMLVEVWNSAKKNKESGSDSSSQELGLSNVGGVFVVLVAGCLLATFTAFGEMFHSVRQRSKKHKVPFRQELKEELKFVAKCSGDTKPVRHRKSSGTPESNSVNSISGKSKESKKSKEKSKSLDHSLDSKP